MVLYYYCRFSSSWSGSDLEQGHVQIVSKKETKKDEKSGSEQIFDEKVSNCLARSDPKEIDDTYQEKPIVVKFLYKFCFNS